MKTETTFIIKTLTENNHKGFLVGGAVRDMFLNKEPKDFDIVTSATPDEVLDIFHKLGFKTIEVGKKFGIVVVIINDIEF